MFLAAVAMLVMFAAFAIFQTLSPKSCWHSIGSGHGFYEESCSFVYRRQFWRNDKDGLCMLDALMFHLDL